MKKVKRGISVIIENKKGEFLMMLRDKTFGIPFPNKWYFPSGECEKGESFKKTAERELKEELDIDTEELIVFKRYHDFSSWSGAIDACVFYLKIDKSVQDTKPNEGVAIDFKNPTEILRLDLAFDHNEIFREFLKQRRRL